MNEASKRYDIHPDGSVSFAGETIRASQVEQLRGFVKAKLPNNEFSHTNLGYLAGYSVGLEVHGQSRIRTGCQDITLDEFRAFLKDYDRGEWKKPTGYKVGQKFRCNGFYGNGGIAIIQQFSGNQYALIQLTEHFGVNQGQSWDGVLHTVEDPNNIQLEELMSSNPENWEPIQ